jgi:hypothetical protein
MKPEFSFKRGSHATAGLRLAHEFSVGYKGFMFSYFSIRNPHVRVVKGKNGFVQVWKFAFIWGI